MSLSSRRQDGGGSSTAGFTCQIDVTVLTAGAKDGSFVRGVIAMILYAIGYPTVLFVASLFAGVAVASRGLPRHGDLITRAGAALLVVLGVATVLYGIGLLRA